MQYVCSHTNNASHTLTQARYSYSKINLHVFTNKTYTHEVSEYNENMPKHLAKHFVRTPPPPYIK